jgi:hypothetical protein
MKTQPLMTIIACRANCPNTKMKDRDNKCLPNHLCALVKARQKQANKERDMEENVFSKLHTKINVQNKKDRQSNLLFFFFFESETYLFVYESRGVAVDNNQFSANVYTCAHTSAHNHRK